ncbi:MAG: insulinase family protein [Rhodospirillaceae bacterium]|nr:insulinase family protein [Rhodospirillaceae bacterium]
MKNFVFAAVLLVSSSALAQTNLKDLKLEIPAAKYVLKNGLTLIVNEDRKAPIVSVQVWYKVGSRDEPAGRSGFAHLFEHLMFNGSEHSDTDWFKPVRGMGGTAINGTTDADRTNYFQTVPTGALESILWLESDRMGHFLGAVSQAKLDEQRGVVQNEKRQGENRPYGFTYERIAKATFPAGHPYSHTTIGSLDDLNAAKLEDVKDWFRTWYGPSNAVIALSGDISPADALAKVEKAFGDIPPGPPVVRAKEWIAKRSGVQRDVGYDRVAQPRLIKVWNVPSDVSRDSALLDLAGDALTGGKTSRLYKRLVHDEQVATSVRAVVDRGEIAGQFYLTVDVKPGVDVAKVEAEVDEELARLLKDGPTQGELDRARTDMAASTARALESTYVKAAWLLDAESAFGDPQKWRDRLDVAFSATPVEVRDAARRWLSDGQYVLTVLPRPPFTVAGAGMDRATLPKPTPTAAENLPALEHATLANGLKLIVASRRAAPMVTMTLAVETGFSDADAALPTGAAAMTVSLMDEGTVSRDGLQISDELRSLGADLSVNGDDERASLSLSTLSSSLDAALALFADVTLHPAFKPEDLERERRQAIVGVERARQQPNAAGARALRALVFGADHPYGRLTTESALTAFTREQAVAYHKRWFTPENATLVVVGDTTLAEIRPKIEKAFAGWRKGSVQRKAVPEARATTSGLYVVDRPGSPQSVIMVGAAAPKWNVEDQVALNLFNDAFGGAFTSRLNMNLREDKHWSYGVRSSVGMDGRGPRLFQVGAPVQTDKTVESVLELRREFTELAQVRPLTADEIAQVKNDTTLALPGRWESLGSVKGTVVDLAYRGLPDDYWSSFASRVNGTTAEELSRVSAKFVRPAEMVWVIVGDAAKIEPEMKKAGIGPVVRVDADGVVLK